MIYGTLAVVESADDTISFFAVKSMDYRRWREIDAPIVETADGAKVKVIREFWHDYEYAPDFWVWLYLEGRASGNLHTYRLD